MKRLALDKLYYGVIRNIVNLLGVIIVFLLQYVLITFFMSIGLVDPAPLEISLGANLPSISISILFHLIPLNVVFIILLSWVYLNKFISERPKMYKSTGRVRKSRSQIKTFYFFNFVPKGPIGVVILFSFLLFILSISLYPSTLYNFTQHLYWSNDLFRAFIKQSSQINSFIIKAVGLFATSFRSSIASPIKSVSDSLLKTNVMWKYLICQNVAAWLTATLVLAYCKHYERKSGWQR